MNVQTVDDNKPKYASFKKTMSNPGPPKPSSHTAKKSLKLYYIISSCLSEDAVTAVLIKYNVSPMCPLYTVGDPHSSLILHFPQSKKLISSFPS